MPIPDKVLRLIERFKEHRESYKDQSYKEAKLRLEFLDDFLEELGSDPQVVPVFQELADRSDFHRWRAPQPDTSHR